MDVLYPDGETIFVPGQDNHLINLSNVQRWPFRGKELIHGYFENWGRAIWCCFRGKCGWTGSTRAFVGNRLPHETPKLKKKREITEESLGLEPLCEEDRNRLREGNWSIYGR